VSPDRGPVEPLTKQAIRKYPRVSASFPVECIVDRRKIRGRASILGGGGLFLQDPAQLPPNTEVTLRFRPAKHLPLIQAKAKARYSIPGQGSGLEFTQISPKHHQIILRLIHRRTANRRQHPRVPLVTQIYCKECMSLAFARDVSVGGMFIETRDPPSVGSRIELRFHLDDGEPIVVAMAEVKYSVAKLGMGVQFIDMASPDRKRIEAYISKCPALPDPAASANPAATPSP